MRVLVTGGAGYVGSFAARRLAARGHDVVTLDNLCQGHRAAATGELIVGDMADRELVGRILRERRIEGVMHFAAATNVAESVVNPRYHYRNNTAGTLALLETMLDHGVSKIVFSSTAATYGSTGEVPLREGAAKNPVCPYGYSKLAIEWMIQDFAHAYGLTYRILRYFNASGAAFDGSHGEDHEPETHLIPLILRAALGVRPHIEIFGTDWETPDGTCVRDYVHVEDLALAHELAITTCPEPGGGGDHFNIGIGRGHSVLEVIAAVERVTGKKVPTKRGPRRQGDPAVLVAANDRLRAKLGWVPTHSDLDQIIASAWRWHSTHPTGYRV
jgi:UDP-glucose 4-epimerase